MVSRLVVDMLRRLPLTQVGIIMLGVMISARGRHGLEMAVSLVLAYVLGPVMLLARLDTPLIPYLPVSRRDAWRARWIVSTVVPAALITAAELPALTLGAVSWSTVTLSGVMDLLYAGAGCAVIALSEARRPAGRMWILLVVLVSILWPFMWRGALPLRWQDVHWPETLALAGGAALTLWGACHTPRGPWRRAFQTRSESSVPSASPPRPSRLSGLPRLLVHELATSIGLGATLMLMFVGMAYTFDTWWGRAPALHDLLARQAFWIFDSTAIRGLPNQFDPMREFGWWTIYVAAVFARFPQVLRHLRALPIARVQLHALLLTWPALVWSLAWLLLVGLHLALGGPHPTAGAQLVRLFASIGVSALGIALLLRLASRWPMAGVATVPMSFQISRMVFLSDGWLIAIGLLSFVAAAALNVNALSRSATYKRPDLLLPRARA
jgi:hypothetical protein